MVSAPRRPAPLPRNQAKSIQDQMSKKKKTSKSAETRKNQRRGRPGHHYHRSDIVLGFFLILLVPALGFLGYYLFWRLLTEDNIFVRPDSL